MAGTLGISNSVYVCVLKGGSKDGIHLGVLWLGVGPNLDSTM